MKGCSAVIAALLVLLLAPVLTGAQDVQSLLNRGMEHSNTGRFDQALEDFNKALQVKPNDPAILTYRGVVHYARRQNDQALKDFGQAVAVDPKFAKAYYQRAQVYASLEKFDLAVADLKKAQSLGYNVDPVYLELMEHKEATAGGWRK